VLLVALFVVGYIAIVFEHPLKLNKTASALLMGVLCWTALVLDHDATTTSTHLSQHFAGIAQIVFFLLGAMTIVELIDAHDGFELITSRITTTSRRKLLVIISLLSFVLSAVLDNLTTSIVMMSLVRKLTSDDRDRMDYGGIVIIAANAGGVWSPIGDVTTTMLWVGGQITTTNLINHLILPSLVSVIVPMLWVGARMKGQVTRARVRETPLARLTGVEAALVEENPVIELPYDAAAIGKTLRELDLRARTGVLITSIIRDGAAIPTPANESLRAGDTLHLAGDITAIPSVLAYLIAGRTPRPTTPTERAIVFFAGVAVLVFVPVFKTLTGLPPVLGILLGLGALWALTEIIHKHKNDEGKGTLSVAGALQRVDSQSVLFFLGILLAIGALESAGMLRALANQLDATIGNINAITVTIGLSSAVVDNVPLVAAAQGMYSLDTFARDHTFWLFLAYCAGTGGSILIIGSAAGIAVMGIQRITFGWYVRRFSLPALLGYFAGALVYLAMFAR
jgi:Na+/H+ antiporter NhaD/arsenite permease-like protein